MTIYEFYQHVGAVFLGNVFSFLLAYALWRATKAERQLGIPDGSRVLPFWALAGAATGPLVLAWSAWGLQ